MENGIRRSGRLLAVALVFTLIGAACGDDDETPAASYSGFSVWSGTSFAAPLIAACVAMAQDVSADCGYPAPAFP